MEYYSLNKYYKELFGCKVYKLSIDGGFTCPNRDGSISVGGCIFCSKGGSGEFAQSRLLSITEQIEKGKALLSPKLPKNGDIKYIAYFQAFTNTYAPIEVLRAKYTEAINHPDIVGISIGTRPDCLGQPVLDLLSELNKIKPIWVELGLQTIHEETAKYIRRGYPLEVYDKAVKDLSSIGVRIVTHVILGLPGESRNDMLETVNYVAGTKTHGIKLQLLFVLKDTDLASEYLANKFTCMEMDEYISILKECIGLLPSDMVVHRVTGDPDKRTLLAPLWPTDKKRVLNAIKKA